MNKQELSETKQWLIERCQELNFGQITFCTASGEPDLRQPWRTTQTVKLPDGANGPRPEASRADFVLCKEQIALFEKLAQIPDGARVTVEVRLGLPFLLQIEREHKAA
ncbi:MAG: hypothetical protein AABZ47_14690 [Planctomycetota bacterium]